MERGDPKICFRLRTVRNTTVRFNRGRGFQLQYCGRMPQHYLFGRSESDSLFEINLMDRMIAVQKNGQEWILVETISLFFTIPDNFGHRAVGVRRLFKNDCTVD